MINDKVYSKVINDNNLLTFKDKMAELDWLNVLNESNPQVAYTSFLNKLKSAYDEAFPLRLAGAKKPQKNKWLSESLKNSIKFKNKLYKKFKREPILFNKNKYHQYKKILRKALRSAEKSYYQSLFELYKSDLKMSWEILKDRIG